MVPESSKLFTTTSGQRGGLATTIAEARFMVTQVVLIQDWISAHGLSKKTVLDNLYANGVLPAEHVKKVRLVRLYSGNKYKIGVIPASATPQLPLGYLLHLDYSSPEDAKFYLEARTGWAGVIKIVRRCFTEQRKPGYPTTTKLPEGLPRDWGDTARRIGPV
jgi:hypothetical protein